MSQIASVRHQRAVVQRWGRCLTRALRRPRRSSVTTSGCSCPPAYHEYGVHGPQYVGETTSR